MRFMRNACPVLRNGERKPVSAGFPFRSREIETGQVAGDPPKPGSKRRLSVLFLPRWKKCGANSTQLKWATPDDASHDSETPGGSNVQERERESAPSFFRRHWDLEPDTVAQAA